MTDSADHLDYLVTKAWNLFQSTPPNRRLLIGIAGIPGSGKTTLAALAVARLNVLAAPESPALCLPMDGFHLTRARLRQMPDPALAAARRGAAWTFDAEGWVSLVKKLRAAVGETVYAPSFDHAVKDPVEGDIAIGPEKRIVVVEGNYVGLDEDGWREGAGMLDQLWYVEVDEEVAVERLKKRHVAAGIVANEEEGERRARENDLPNGRETMGKRVRVDERVGVDGAKWVKLQ